MTDAVVKNTQNSLGQFVKKPPLTDKLLKKPPFRFLHDVISVVIRETGALKGLYTDKEMKSDNVKDRDAKIAYLEKAINAVQFATGDTLTVKPSKIVSGHEPDKTNEFLQALAKICQEKIDTSEAVSRVKKGEKPGKPAAGGGGGAGSRTRRSTLPRKPNNKTIGGRENGSRATSRSRSHSRDNVNKSRENSSNPESRSGHEGENGTTNGAGEPPADVMSPLPEGEEASSAPAPVNGHEPAAVEEDSRPEPEQHSQQPESTMNGGTFGEPVEPVAEPELPEPPPKPRPASAVKSARPRTGRMKSARPPSARRPAPRLKEKTEILAEEEVQQRPLTGKVANVILAGKEEEEDDAADEFLVEEKPKDTLDLLTEQPSAPTDLSAVEGGGEDHGGLVKQILDTQKVLEQTPDDNRKVEIERDTGLTDLGRRRDREATQREVDKLRDSIQTLTRSANPLGKLMDFLQEDVDAMQRELDNWKNENRRLQQALKAEQKLTEQSIEPLRTHLQELEQATQEQQDKIAVVKANIIKNDDKIAKLISTIGLSGR